MLGGFDMLEEGGETAESLPKTPRRMVAPRLAVNDSQGNRGHPLKARWCYRLPHEFRIRIVEKSSNRRGDLFARLMSDLFVSLGYDEIRLNVAKAGREIDLKGRHRFEERRIVVECKAAKEPAGGDVVNKFVGVLDAERRRYSGETIGYLISLGGFRQTAIEQEEDLGSRRVILMDAEKVARELVHGRILVSSDIAIAIGLVCASKIEHQLSLVMPLELLATRFGWVWLIRFGYGGLCTHYALIHADGSSMPSRAVLDVLEDDHALCRDLGTALFLQGKRDTEADIDATRERYLRYLSEQCGEIQLAGLPADEEVGSRRLRLEKLFVPLHLDPLLRADSDAKECRLSLGKVLKKQTRIAILGAPGVGKSTLIKRVAVAYSDPSRRKEVADDLPERNWFPLLIRCRQLGTAARFPIEEILLTIPERAEMRMEKSAFNMLVQDALRDGSALLLIDGLDEIVEDGDRVAFVDQLRAFLSRYASVALILTSREVGFRIVAGSLATTCRHFALANLDAADVRRLTIAWHMEVVGTRREVYEDAENLATAITQSNRVMRLAENPLLLTTLLLVRRPRGRCRPGCTR
jgi:energy-coupling factor transporter ATP-binding protein EcfA2